MSTIPDRQLVATDDLVERDTAGRLGVFILWLVFIFGGFPIFFMWITASWFNYGTIGLYVGLMISALILHITLPRFIVQVEALRAFVTVDLLHAFLARRSKEHNEEDPKAYVTYGPGLHISYPWESRRSRSNVSLEEASESFEAKVQTKVGTFTLRGSTRLRPDIRRLVPFLSGVGVVASDVTDLIKAFGVEILGSEKDMMKILTSIGKINDKMNVKFGLGKKGRVDEDPKASDFERRFGLNVGDVTVAELLPSPEVQKTLSGIAEAQLVQEGTALILNYPDAAAMQADRNSGKLAQETIDRGRRDFLAASEQVEMHVEANDITFRLEANPELTRALGDLAPALLPVIQLYLQQQARSGGSQKGRSSPKKSNRNRSAGRT